MANDKKMGEPLLFMAISIVFLFFLEMARELIGTVYNYNLANMGINATVLSLLAFFGPLLFIPLGKVLKGQWMVLVPAALIVLVRIPMSLFASTELYMVWCLVGVASFGVLGVSLFTHMKAGWLGLAVMVGAGLDMMFRAMGGTYDLLLYWGGTPLLSLIVVLPLSALAIFGFWYNEYVFREAHQIPLNWLDGIVHGLRLGGLSFLYLGFLGFPNVISFSGNRRADHAIV